MKKKFFYFYMQEYAAINEKILFSTFFTLVIVINSSCSDDAAVNENVYRIVICYKSLARSAEDVEADITIPVEEKLASLQFIRSINSASSSGLAIITVEISQESHVEAAQNIIKNQLSLIRPLLPADIPDPIVTHVADNSESNNVCK